MPKILIVDDDVTITELMKALVKIDGHEPTTVNDSLKAVEVAQAVHPDLITLDLMRPGLTGSNCANLCIMIPDFQRSPSLSSARGMRQRASRKPSKQGRWLTSPSHSAWTTS